MGRGRREEVMCAAPGFLSFLVGALIGLVGLAFFLISVVTLARERRGRFSATELHTLAAMIGRMAKVLHFQPVGEANYLDILAAIWSANLAVKEDYIDIQKSPQDVRVLKGRVGHPQEWLQLAEEQLAGANFRWLPGDHELRKPLPGRGAPLLFRLEDQDVSRTFLVLMPALCESKKEIFAEIFSAVADLTEESRQQARSAEQVDKIAEYYQTKYLRALKVLSALNHNLRGTFSALLTHLFLARQDTKEGQIPLAAQRKIVETVFPLLDVGQELLGSFGTSFESLLEGSVNLPLCKQPLKEIFEKYCAAWLKRQDSLRPKINIQWEIPAELVILTPEEFFFQIVWNVLHNALKYTKEGCVRIWASEGQDGRVYLRVKDSGMGIAPKDLEHLGTFTYRGTALQRMKGEGVGLWGVYQFMGQIGGAVEIESKVGQGTTVHLGFQNGSPRNT
jgi:signal transduction histidine kinase